ncbi:MAG: SUMF1/EgtB/PvdO family nonheme iron enzyme [Candidatus Cloacimonetes bacterium]|nr:SUMF1/EgtB/PvdO family nonheme iron enzyme [Candidatus Cloacimonadota bacterium]
MRKALLVTVLCVLLTGAFSFSSNGISASVANDKLNPKLSIINVPSSNPKEVMALPVSSHYAPKTGTPPVLQLELNLDGQMLLSWAAITGATGYNIYYAEIPDPIESDVWMLLTTLPSGTLSYLVNPDQPMYFYYVTALLPEDNPLILVEGGAFNNGTSDVTISSFYLDKYELTQDEYVAVMDTNPTSGYGNFGVGSNHPIYNVSWFNAIEYSNRRSMQEGLTPCYSYSTYGTNPAYWPGGWNTSNANHTNVSCDWTANGYRLPTEAEWQFAARGGNQTHNYTYSGSDDIDAVAWFYNNACAMGIFYPDYGVHTVGTKLANELGLYDMSGNIWEWCWDTYGSYPSGSQNNPTGANSGLYRMLRGGAWNHNSNFCEVSDRYYNEPANYYYNIGFRVCRSVENFVLVNGGTFNNGTSDVTVSSFYLGKYELTQDEYQAVMGTNPASGYGEGSDYPVYNVSWFDAIKYSNLRSMQEGLTPCYSYRVQDFYYTNPADWPSGWNTNANQTNISCNWAANGYRLPTEMEWMYAAKGGNTDPPNNYTYSGSNIVGEVAWCSPSSGSTHIVGTKLANELGLYDMSGNVHEWCWDIYGDYPSGAQTNPHGATIGTTRALRGGGWSYLALVCAVTYRSGQTPVNNHSGIGFRVCRISVR